MELHVTLPQTSFGPFLIDSANQTREDRSQSEDYVLVDPKTGLLGVFDSVGGRDKGRFVSHLAGKTIASAWQAQTLTERQGLPTQIEASLQALIRLADTTIASLLIPPEHKRPATTFALSVLSWKLAQASLTLAHIGDSRVYLWRAGQPLQRLTQDHSYFSSGLQHGRMTQEESWRIEQAKDASDFSPLDQLRFARRNEITCVVGWTDFPSIPVSSLSLDPW